MESPYCSCRLTGRSPAGCGSCNCDSWDAAHPDAQAADSPFNADRFDIAKVAGGLKGIKVRALQLQCPVENPDCSCKLTAAVS